VGPSRIDVGLKPGSSKAMDTDKIKIFGARVKVDSTGKLAELERAERVQARFYGLLNF
jgi:T-complex protein 1 subunit beta